MKLTPKTDALIGSLTIEQAREYERQTDKIIWIETMLLDPNNIGRGMAEKVESALLHILESVKS